MTNNTQLGKPAISYTMRQRFAALWWAIVILGLPGLVQGQRLRVIGAAAQCTDCRIRVEKVSVLGSENGPGFVGRPVAVRQWQDTWAVTHNAKQASISLSSMNGPFITDMGREGDGPGEFRHANKLALRGDTLFAFDADLGRVTAYASRTSQPVTIGSGLPAPLNFDVLGDGRFLLSAQIRTRDAAGLPLHFVDRSGQVERSFGADRAVVDPRLPHANQRVQTIAPDGTIWVSHRTAYVLEQRDGNGKVLQKIERQVRWFKPHGREESSIRAPHRTPLSKRYGSIVRGNFGLS